jgi:formylmethanofuran dehydrogenase subunit E
MQNVIEATDCVKCGNYTTVMEQVIAVKTGKMLCEFCR